MIRRDPHGRLTFTLLNDPADTDLDTLVRASCQRHFVERVIEDAKFELGWDDFCARKYLAWEHHVALTAAALWFIAQVKLGWQESYQRDPRLKKVFELEVLPALTMANVRDLLQAALPLPRLGPALLSLHRRFSGPLAGCIQSLPQRRPVSHESDVDPKRAYGFLMHMAQPSRRTRRRGRVLLHIGRPWPGASERWSLA